MYNIKRLYFKIFLLVFTFFTGAAVIITDIYIGVILPQKILMKIIILIIISCAFFYIPDILHALNYSSEQSKKRKELRFLKKTFVICGSIKPVDYLQIMNALYERALYYRSDLEHIIDTFRKSNIDKEEFFSDLLSQTKDLNSKLFFEKLSIGFLYDFDAAVNCIRDDFEQEKRECARMIKKQVGFLHTVGVTGLFIAMTILLLYMLKPWLSSMNIKLF